MPAVSERTRFKHDPVVSGGWVFRTDCQDCRKPITLECGDYEPPPGWAKVIGERAPMNASQELRTFRMIAQFADMIVCSACQAVEEKRRKDRDERREISNRIDETGLPIALRNLRWGQMIPSGKRAAAIVAAQRWAENPDARGLLLWGAVGTGKTRLAATAVTERLKHGACRWCSVAALIAQLQASFADEDRRRALQVLTGTEPLVLDDLDKVKLTETVSNQLFVALDRRINSGVPLLVTTNLPPGDLEAKFGDAIGSRLLGYCTRQMFQMDGPDRRLASQTDGGEEMAF